MFDEYSWRLDDYEMALERRAAEQNHISAVRTSWQQSAIYKASKREAHKRYRAKHKPWLRPDRREYMRKYRAEKRASGELHTNDTERAKLWRQANRDRYNAYQREYAKAHRVPKQRKRTDPETLKQRKREHDRAVYRMKILDPKWVERRREISRNTARRLYAKKMAALGRNVKTRGA